jgi:two-component system sensor histidine kinase UhpB
VGWSVEDDGVGLGNPAAAMQRGNGLGGMQERVWALGGQWRLASDGSSPGLRLQARLPLSRADADPPS